MLDRPYTIDDGRLTRFDRRMTVFVRRDTFDAFDFYRPDGDDDPALPLLAEARASWIVNDCFAGAYGDAGLLHRRLVRDRPVTRFAFESPASAAENVKEVAGRFGASLAGITRLDPAWLYSHERSGAPVALPPDAKWAVVMAVRMDPSRIALSPGFEAAAATGRGYSAMASLAASVAEYLRQLGYYARSCGNDTALSIPLAVDAGLGVQGRNGLLLTREFGPCVRLCKVITDLELVQDESDYPDPVDVCGTCRLCAEACEADALSRDDSPCWEVPTRSNNPGVLRWRFDPEKCFDFWLEKGRDCSNCIAACPAASRLSRSSERNGLDDRKALSG